MNTEKLLEELNSLSKECRRAQAMEIIANQKLAAAIRKGERLCRLLESLHIKDDFQTVDAIDEWREFRKYTR